MPTISMGGQRFAISFVNSFLSFWGDFFIKSKSECFQKFKVLCAQVGTSKVLPTGNGTEYSGKTFADFCIQKGIKREFTAPYSLHQNGVCERRWRTTVEMAPCLLKKANYENEFWVRALDTAFYITNRCLISSLLKGKTPFDMFFGEKPDLSNFRVFGRVAYKFIETHQDKLSPKATEGHFVGYAPSKMPIFSLIPKQATPQPPGLCLSMNTLLCKILFIRGFFKRTFSNRKLQ